MPLLKNSCLGALDTKRFSARSVRLLKKVIRNSMLAKSIKGSLKVYANDYFYTIITIDGWMVPKHKERFFRVFFWVNGDVIENFEYQSPEPSPLNHDSLLVDHDSKALTRIAPAIIAATVKNSEELSRYHRELSEITAFNLKIAELLSELQPTIGSLFSEFERTK